MQAGLFALPGLLGALGVYLFGRGEDQLFHEGAVAAEGVSFDAERCRVAAKRDVNPHAVLFPFEYERRHGVTRSVADQPEVEALQFRAEIQPVLFALHGLGLQSEVSGNISRSFGFALREEELPADVRRTVLLDQPFDDDRIIFIPQVRFVFSRMCIPIECFSLFGSEPENPERLSLDSVCLETDYFEGFSFDGFRRGEPARFGSRRKEVPSENARLHCRASAGGCRFVFVEPGTVGIAVKGVDPEILGADLSAGFAQPHRVDAHDGGRFREEVEVGDRAEIGVNVPGIEQDALPDEAFVIGGVAARADVCRRIVYRRRGFLRRGAVRQDGLDFELCRSVCDAAETEQGGEEAFHLFVVWTQR